MYQGGGIGCCGGCWFIWSNALSNCCNPSVVRLGGGGGRGLEGDDDSSQGGVSWVGGGRPSSVRNSGGSTIPSSLTSKSAQLLQGNSTPLSKEGSLPKVCGVHW